ncbi:hypothetical protein ACWIUD_04005 [Helicobacter sp. 23-1044]
MSNVVAQNIKNYGIEAFNDIDSDSLPQSVAEIKEVAKQAANAICKHFERLTEMQEAMRNLSYEAKNAKSDLRNTLSLGLFGKSKKDKKIDILTDKGALQDEHNIELLKLQQVSIQLSLLSAKLSSAMISEMQICIKNGFEDTNGRIKKLSQNSQQQVKLLMQNIEQSKKQNEKFGWIIKAIIAFVAIALGVFLAVKFAI